MTAFILALLAGLAGALPHILTLIETKSNERKRKADALADIELKQTQDAMAAADRELERLSPAPPKQPILLSSDDHL